MVSTRHHPREFPPPEIASSTTPSKSSSPPSPSTAKTPRSKATPKSTAVATRPAVVSRTKSVAAGYVHAPDRALVIWLLASLPLVAWDALYVFLRPHSMPGGKLHSPIWTPYALYGTIDYTYGWPAWNGGVGFTAAQSALNVLESVLYVYYLVIVWKNSTALTLEKGLKWYVWDENKAVADAGLAVLLCFTGAVMTVSKTLLYLLNEYYSNFENIGHNSWFNIVVLWIIPNGLWIVGPSYMLYILSKELLSVLDTAGAKKSR